VAGREVAMIPIIRITGLTKNFGEKEVLRGVDLEIPPGQILGYIGPNGAGKTTTVKILCGMLDAFAGEATVCGFDVASQPLEVKRRIGYIPESAALYDALTPLEYLRFIGRLYGMAEVEVDQQASELLGLLGLGAEADERMSTFSKGMRQKVLITAGLMHDPAVVFMDEPLSGLDANSVVIVKEIITRLAEGGKTVFYCSHVMDVVERVCHRIAIIDDGRIISDGTFEELQAQSTGGSLERIFTQLTGDGSHQTVADKFVATLSRGSDGDD
jgi:ABC-2 type transport system ATP-binding protein